MKKKLLVILAILLVIAVTICIVFYKKTPTKDDIFKCETKTDITEFVDENNIAYEKHENTFHLFDVYVSGISAYCVADFAETTGEVIRIECFMSFDKTAATNNQAETLRKHLIELVDIQDGECDYEFFPLDSDRTNVSEADYLSGKASKELYVYEDDKVWNISWFISSDGSVSAKMSKTVTY